MEKRKIGRNDPCYCRSGKKYKHCHYEEDMKKREDIDIFPEKDVLSPTHKRLLGIQDNKIDK